MLYLSNISFVLCPDIIMKIKVLYLTLPIIADIVWERGDFATYLLLNSV